MKRILFLIGFVGMLVGSAKGQITNCTQVLRLAQSTYEQGRLHELPTMMTDCLQKSEDAGGFTKQQRVEAYRYLTLAYIYLEEPEKADEMMLSLLRTDHYFEINELVDPAEFIGLYKTFRTTPVFSIGAKFGVNTALTNLMSNSYVGNSAVGKGHYTNKVAFQAGIVFEKNFFDGSKNDFLRRLTFAPELFYNITTTGYSNAKVFESDSLGTSVATLSNTPTLIRISLNPIFQYKLSNSQFNPYVGFGPGVGFVASSSYQLVLTRNNSIGTVSGPSVPTKNSFSPIVPSLIATLGIKYKFGSIKLLAEVRVQYGLSNIVNGDKRTNSQAAFDYAYVPSNESHFNTAVNLGFVFPYFNPIKKKIKK